MWITFPGYISVVSLFCSLITLHGQIKGQSSIPEKRDTTKMNHFAWVGQNAKHNLVLPNHYIGTKIGYGTLNNKFLFRLPPKLE